MIYSAQRQPSLLRADASALEERVGLQQAQVSVGGRADLYPSVRIGAQLGFESDLGSALPERASRAWSIGPRLDLPIFDRGRRKAVVQLRELQQEAAIAYQRAVLQAWQQPNWASPTAVLSSSCPSTGGHEQKSRPSNVESLRHPRASFNGRT